MTTIKAGTPRTDRREGGVRRVVKYGVQIVPLRYGAGDEEGRRFLKDLDVCGPGGEANGMTGIRMITDEGLTIYGVGTAGMCTMGPARFSPGNSGDEGEAEEQAALALAVAAALSGGLQSGREGMCFGHGGCGHAWGDNMEFCSKRPGGLWGSARAEFVPHACLVQKARVGQGLGLVRQA